MFLASGESLVGFPTMLRLIPYDVAVLPGLGAKIAKELRFVPFVPIRPFHVTNVDGRNRFAIAIILSNLSPW